MEAGRSWNPSRLTSLFPGRILQLPNEGSASGDGSERRGTTMPTIITDLSEVTIPTWVDSLETFRRWTEQPDFPQKGRIWWLRGQVWIDMSREQIFSHILVKTEI